MVARGSGGLAHQIRRVEEEGFGYCLMLLLSSSITLTRLTVQLCFGNFAPKEYLNALALEVKSNLGC